MQNMVLAGGSVVIVALIAFIGIWAARQKHGKKGATNTSKLVSSLRDERAKSDIILNAIDDGVALIDDAGVVQLFNPAASTITGWKREEAEGLDWKLIFKIVDKKGEAIPVDQMALSRVFADGIGIRDNSSTLLTKAGKTVALSSSVTPLKNAQDKVTGAVAIFRDVSQERQEENQRAEFISTASHEMRTPVAAIEGYLSLALNDKVATIDTRARDFLVKAHTSTQHLGQLFQDLLTSAKAEDGRLTNHPRVVEIGDFLTQLNQDLRFTAQKKQLGMEFLIGSSGMIDASTPVPLGGDKVVRPLYYVLADPDRMREVLTNLFDNACKYTDSGKISLGLTGNDSVVQMYIRDTGAGIPTEDIPHLFQKFYRVDNSATRTIGGTGLGLFICRKIVELYQGRIWVESTVGKGSTFYINLPRLTAQKAEQLRVAETAKDVQTVGALEQSTATVVPAATGTPAA